MSLVTLKNDHFFDIFPRRRPGKFCEKQSFFVSSLGFNCPISVLNESRHHAEGLDSHLSVIGLMKK